MKKLVLAKETVRNFSDRELAAAQGGSFTWQDSQKWCLPHPSNWTDTSC